MAHEGWLTAYAALVARHRDHLNRLDAAIGDADHGSNMHRGLVAAVDSARPYAARPCSAGAVFTTVGLAFVSTVGGASGPLFGDLFLRMGGSLDDGEGPHPVAPDRLAAAFAAGLSAVVSRGRAEPGDKTMYDAMAPAVQAFAVGVARGATTAVALRAAAAAAVAGRDATVPMTARKGRASYLGSRSVGHQDPGATSVALFFQAVQQQWDRPAPHPPIPLVASGGST